MSSAAFHRVNRQNPCPICGKHDWCRTFEDGGVECMRVESPVSCKSGGWMHYPDGDWRDHVTAPPVTTVVTDKAPEAEINDVYRWLLYHCMPSPGHRAMLEGRGLDGRKYGTLTADEDIRRRIAAEIQPRTSNPDSINRTPGFYWHPDGGFSIAGAPGLLIPIRNAAGQIVGIQIRKDEGEPRYSFLSSRGYPGGTGSGSPVHVRNNNDAGPTIITEGPLKADYLASPEHCWNVIAVPGVNNIRGVLPALADLKADFVHVAYDMDWKTNPQVKKARGKLMQILWCEGYQVSSFSWDPAYKGIDDALRAGCDLIQTDYDPDGAVPCARIYEGGY